MRRLTLASSTALGIVVGGVLFNAPRALADLPTIDVASLVQQAKAFAQETGILDVLSTINTVQTTINNGISDLNKALGVGTFGDVQTLLQQGFTQTANYAKAQVGALTQLFDASNTANARFQRDMRNAQIRDEHTPSPLACSSLDGGVSTQSAGMQAFTVAATIAHIHDLRGAASVGMPSHFGQAQAVASMSAEHNGLYCNADDDAAGVCPSGVSNIQDADQQMLSLFGSGTYKDQAAVNTAKDYAINLIQPLAPPALRGDQLASTAGQDAAVRRHSYNARMSLAQSFVDTAIGMQTPSVPLTPIQAQFLQNMGLPAQTNGSWLQVLQIEAERRISDVTWNANLQSMPPASVQREIASEMAMNNYLMFQNYKMQMMHATIDAARLAEDTEREFMPTVRMPTPSMVAASSGP